MIQTTPSRRRPARALGLMCGASVALMAAFTATSAGAQAATAAGSTEVGEVVVTGTSIRGAAPVGSSVVAVGQDDIQKTGAQTVQQVLRSVPSVVGMGAVGQGAFGSADGAGTNAPTIHGLGASASNSTLILIDGHRFPLSGINHALADPNILPTLALERVEVLADGASSVYGSDAVAGVINFITRRRFDGVEAAAQAAYGKDYNAYSAGLVAGKIWDSGSLLAAYGYSDRSALSNADRSFTALDKRPLGGSNLGSFFCGPATIQPTGSALIFTSPYNAAGLVNAPANAPCDTSGQADLIPSEVRHSLMVKVTQQIADRLTLNGDLVFSKRDNDQRNQRGTVQATIFGPGSANTSQINPFYTGVAGSTATSESVRFDANQLLGPGAHTASGEKTYYVSGNLEYKVSDNWNLTAGGVIGSSDSFSKATGALCTSCALLALNGATNGGGSLTAVSVPGTTTIILNTPLTAANALDVFNTGSANRTSPAVLARLTDSAVTQLATQTLKDATIKLDGTLFELPAGPIRAAIGGEVIYYTLEQNVTRPLGTGPATTGSSFLHLDYDRDVRSAFAELLVPLVGPEMNVPFVRRLDVNVSGRYDKYSDFGSTSNPRIGGNWEVVDGFKFRANY
ncbi:MAG: TonB-dependent receptor, partial [Phenylobacterium sp.]